VERLAAEYAGVDDSQIIVWIPDPNMRLKIAEVLVDFERGVAPYNQYSEKGGEIYADHKALWTVTVFVHPAITRDGLEPVVLARLAQLMAIEWDRHRPSIAQRPDDWPLCLAGSRSLGGDAMDVKLQALLETEQAQRVAHRSSGMTFADLLRDIQPLAQAIKRHRPRDAD